jgi:glycine/D-amino acid oxidase-like deaminating enzyme
MMNAFLKDRFRWEDVFQQADHRLAKTGMRGFEHMIENRAEGQINTGKMMHRLLHQCRQLGVEILFSTPVESIQQESSGHRLAIHRTESIKAKQVVITTNGFARQFLPEEDVIPARAQVLVTKPIPELKFQGCYHMDEGYYYFRAIGNRVLFGGGRNLDKAGETTISQETTPLIQDRLSFMLQEYILPNQAFEIETRWAGTMGIGASKMPIVKQTASGIFVGVRMGGMGVAIGSEIAQQLAQKIERVL